jgi:hypothetical protein
MYLLITTFCVVVVIFCATYGVWQFESYEYAPGCTVEKTFTCGAWLWDTPIHSATIPIDLRTS